MSMPTQAQVSTLMKHHELMMKSAAQPSSSDADMPFD